MTNKFENSETSQDPFQKRKEQMISAIENGNWEYDPKAAELKSALVGILHGDTSRDKEDLDDLLGELDCVPLKVMIFECLETIEFFVRFAHKRKAKTHDRPYGLQGLPHMINSVKNSIDYLELAGY